MFRSTGPTVVVSPDPTLRRDVDPEVRVVVVGGGLAGAAAAATLADRGARVVVCEASDRLGGRLAVWPHVLPDGCTVVVDHGFHAFFRQYYNLRAFLRRFDPALDGLRPVPSYPIISRRGSEEIGAVPGPPAVKALLVLARSPSLRLGELRHVDGTVAAALLSYDPRQTYALYDGMSVADLLDAMGLPARTRTGLLDVFARSGFDRPETLSAAELIALCHFYFLGHRDGLLFDTPSEDYRSWLWKPFEQRIAAAGGEVRTNVAVDAIEPAAGGQWAVRLQGGEAVTAAHVVIAADAGGARDLVARSPALTDTAPHVAKQIQTVRSAPAYAVVRMWVTGLDLSRRPSFAAVAGEPTLDVVVELSRLSRPAIGWARANNGHVIEMQAYAVPDDVQPSDLARRMRQELTALWPEVADGTVVDIACRVEGNASSFPVGGDATRPGVVTGVRGLYLAGDWVRVPLPAALMERAAVSGVLAANAVLAEVGATAEPVWSVRPRGLLAGTRLAARSPVSRREG